MKWNISDIAKKGYNVVFSNRGNWDRTIDEFKIEAFRTSSRWYSTKKSIELKNKYEQENNIKYDWILICRFDSHATLKYKFNLNALPNDYIYLQKRNSQDKNYSFGDLWILSNSYNSNYFGNMFDERFKYCIRCPISIFEMINKNKLNYKLL